MTTKAERADRARRAISRHEMKQYHSPLSGAKLKGGGAGDAPVSLYTDLPKRFCFERTPALPAFIKRRRSFPAGLWMHRMCL